MSIWKRVGPFYAGAITDLRYQNSDPSSLWSGILIKHHEDGGISVEICPNKTLNQSQRDQIYRLQNALEDKGFILEFEFSNFKINKQSDHLRIKELFELIKNFESIESIDEMIYQEMLNDIYFKRPEPPSSTWIYKPGETYSEFTFHNYVNTTPASILGAIQLHTTRGGYLGNSMSVTGFPSNVENQKYRKMVEQLIQHGFSQNDSLKVTSNNQQQQPLRIKEFFEIIMRFETIDEETYKEMLRRINVITPLDDLMEKVDLLIAQGKPQEAVNEVQKENDRQKYTRDWQDPMWDLVKRFESKEVEPSILIQLYEAIPQYTPHYQEAQLKLYILQAPLNETPDEKEARHKQGLASAIAGYQVLFIHHHFNELSSQALSGHPPARNLPELLINAAETMATLQDEVHQLREYKAKKEASELTAGLLVHGTFAGSLLEVPGSPEPEDLGSPEPKGPTSMVTLEPPQLFMS
jgi:hypothetical protein